MGLINNKTGASLSARAAIEPEGRRGGKRAIDEQMASPKESVFSKWGAALLAEPSLPTGVGAGACNAWQLARAAEGRSHCTVSSVSVSERKSPLWRRKQRGPLRRVADLICMRVFIIRR